MVACLGGRSVFGQLSYKPSSKTQIALTYVRNHAPDGNIRSGVGSVFAQNPFAGQSFSADSIGLEGTFGITKNFAIGGWAGYTKTNTAATNMRRIFLMRPLILPFPILGLKGGWVA
jgi:hypothetical protein